VSIKRRPVVFSEKFPKHSMGGESREFACRNAEITILHGQRLFLRVCVKIALQFEVLVVMIRIIYASCGDTL
jgi:hypothetical protein